MKTEPKYFYTILLCNGNYESDTNMGCGDPYSSERYDTIKQAQERIDFMEYPEATPVSFISEWYSEFKEIKKKLKITNNDIARMFDYKNKLAYANSSAKTRIETALISFYLLIKKSDGKKIKRLIRNEHR